MGKNEMRERTVDVDKVHTHNRRWSGSLGNTFAARECFAKWTRAWRVDDAQKNRCYTMQHLDEHKLGGVLLLPETNILLSPLEPHLWNIFDCSDKSYTQWNVDGDDHHDCHHHSYHSIEYLASHFHSKIFRFPFWGKWGIIVDFWTVWRQCTARCCVKRDNL